MLLKILKSSIQLYPGMAKLLLFSCLLLALCTVTLSASVFLSIDCGSSATYKDELGITWTGDDKYVKTGEAHSVPPSNSTSRVTETLRVFKNQSRNCYIINSMKKGRILLRATFYYGNYDGKSSPPKFQIMFDGYDWGSVNNSGPTPSRFEVIYTMKKDSISFCLAQIAPGQFPYISGLEVRSLEPYMYLGVADENYPLYARRRLAFGTNATIRYPDDPYDRTWMRERDLYSTGLIQVSGNANLSSGLSDDNPPPAVLKTAVTSASPNTSIDFVMALSSDFDSSVYINWYFSEVTRLQPNQTRSFYIYKDNKPFSDIIIPPYGNLTQKYVSNLTASANTSFSLVPTENTTLPPLINAMEVFILGDYPLQVGTHENDVEGLASLQEAFSSLQDWTGDPCLPEEYPWAFVKCTKDFVPRVTTLLLGGYRLSGFLPDFSSMGALHTINLSNNSLRGNIPEFLATLPNLQILNLENNQFNGTIPASLSAKKGLILRVSGNPELCTSSTSCPTSERGGMENSSVRKRMKILEILLATIISSTILLHLS